jgi:hypothetical protein
MDFSYFHKRGSRYYISFIDDDHTRYYWAYLMKQYSEFFEIYTTFRAPVKTQNSTVIKCFRSDLGDKYNSNKFCEFLSLDETIHQTSCTDTLEQNEVAERKHRHIIETARSLLLSASVPGVFWGEVVLTIVGLINIILSFYILYFSHFENLYEYAPDYSFFRVFCRTCFVLYPHVECSKLFSQFVIFVLLGYDKGKKGYRCFDPMTQKLYVSSCCLSRAYTFLFYSIHYL